MNKYEQFEKIELAYEVSAPSLGSVLVRSRKTSQDKRERQSRELIKLETSLRTIYYAIYNTLASVFSSNFQRLQIFFHETIKIVFKSVQHFLIKNNV